MDPLMTGCVDRRADLCWRAEVVPCLAGMCGRATVTFSTR